MKICGMMFGLAIWIGVVSSLSAATDESDLDSIVARDLDLRVTAYQRITEFEMASCLGKCGTPYLFIAEYLHDDSVVAVIAVQADTIRTGVVLNRDLGSFRSIQSRCGDFLDRGAVVSRLAELGFAKISTPQLMHCALGMESILTVDCADYGILFWEFRDLEDGSRHLFLRTCRIVPYPTSVDPGQHDTLNIGGQNHESEGNN